MKPNDPDDRLAGLLRAGFPPTPELFGRVARELDGEAAGALRGRWVAIGVASAAAVLAGAVFVGVWAMRRDPNPVSPPAEPTRPAEIAAVAPITTTELAVFRSAPPVSRLAVIKSEQNAWLAALDAALEAER